MKIIDKLLIIGAIVCILSAVIIYISYDNKYNQHLENPEVVVTEVDETFNEDEVDDGFATEAMQKEEVTVYKSVLEIPSQNILVNIYDGISNELLKKGVCRYENTSVLGGVGVSVICGHYSSKWDYVFNNLVNVKLNDEFFIWDNNGKKHKYIVNNIFIVEPTEVWILEQDDTSCSKVRLFCCTNGGKQRLVVEGTEFDEEKYIKELADANYNKLLELNSNIDLPSHYLEVLNWYNKGNIINEVDKNLVKDFYTNFGIHLNRKELLGYDSTEIES